MKTKRMISKILTGCIILSFILTACSFTPPISSADDDSVDDNQTSNQIFINEDLISDIGLTYGELSKKYAEATNVSGFEGELFADFGNRSYRFIAGENNESAYSGNGGFDAVANADAVCVSIDTIAVNLFFDIADGYSLSDLESHGISAAVVSSRPASSAGEIEGNYCHFEYANCDIYITLDGNDYDASNGFTQDSDVFISLLK